MSKTRSKVKTAVTVILVIMLLILSLGLLARLTNVFGNKIAVTYNGTKITKDIAGANGGRGEDFTEVFEIEKTEKGFKISGGIKKVLKDIWPGKDIELPEELPSGDKFRMEITSEDKTLKIGFQITPGGVEKIELWPGEIIF